MDRYIQTKTEFSREITLSPEFWPYVYMNLKKIQFYFFWEILMIKRSQTDDNFQRSLSVCKSMKRYYNDKLQIGGKHQVFHLPESQKNTNQSHSHGECIET
jgi:hypothetical protein